MQSARDNKDSANKSVFPLAVFKNLLKKRLRELVNEIQEYL